MKTQPDQLWLVMVGFLPGSASASWTYSRVVSFPAGYSSSAIVWEFALKPYLLDWRLTEMHCRLPSIPRKLETSLPAYAGYAIRIVKIAACDHIRQFKGLHRTGWQVCAYAGGQSAPKMVRGSPNRHLLTVPYEDTKDKREYSLLQFCYFAPRLC